MASPQTLTPAVREDMEHRGIDVDLSLRILESFNAGRFDHFAPVEVDEIPQVDGATVVDFTGSLELRLPLKTARDRLEELVPSSILGLLGTTIGEELSGEIVLARKDLVDLGLMLLPRVAYGVLNGGSATSYADSKKNRSFSQPLFDLVAREFEGLAEVSAGRAKGLTPAFIQADGTHGPSFLLLKMRALLLMAQQCRRHLETVAPGARKLLPAPLLPMFQMTSIHTDSQLAEQCRSYAADPCIDTLMSQTGLDPTATIGQVQPLISAYTHSDTGRPKRVFTGAYGDSDRTLPLPGGHGQSFSVLASTYRELYRQGKRYAYLGNVDNLGFLPDPAEVAWLALTGKQAGFDFAVKTAVDVKGGVLVRDARQRLNCADIGPAISPREIERMEAQGRPILFNAATGLFSLEFLVPQLDHIAENLPTRFSDQDKDAGKYSQAEQVTWEVIGMLDEPLIFSVAKWDRMLAAKLLLETLMTSGVAMDNEDYPTSADPSSDLRSTARMLNNGLIRKLSNDYGMVNEGGRWVPAS